MYLCFFVLKKKMIVIFIDFIDQFDKFYNGCFVLLWILNNLLKVVKIIIFIIDYFDFGVFFDIKVRLFELKQKEYLLYILFQ